MANKKFWLGMLVMALVFGMAVVGCDDSNDRMPLVTSSPTGLQGTVISPPNNSVKLTWNPVDNAKEYFIEYRENPFTGYGDGFFSSGNSTTTSYTATDLDYTTSYSFRVWGIPYDATIQNDPFYSAPITIETGIPLTEKVYVRMNTTRRQLLDQYTYEVSIILTLPHNVSWNDSVNATIVKSWVTMSGTPDVNTWSVSAGKSSLRSDVYLTFSQTNSNPAMTISGLTATINTEKLTEMKIYTNVRDSLTVGSSSSSSEWKSPF
jgi:hypothetical protein